MPGLRDFLKKKERIGESRPQSSSAGNVPEFSFIRSTTEAQEKVYVPDFPDDATSSGPANREASRDTEPLGFRNSANAAYTKDPTARPETDAASEKAGLESPRKSKDEKRLSARLHLHRYSRSRSRSQETSTNIPENLPEIPASVTLPPGSSQNGDVVEDPTIKEQREAQWEKRATMLAMSNPLLDASVGARKEASRSRSPSISDAKGDVNIQEAIRLHESGELTESTHMFGQLANPKGANNALAQVLYGLALRHGWGVEIEPEKAIHYLSLAASNSASIEEQALTSGLKKGGAAKGELVLAIFELANCFRHGWGVKKDAIAARQYYETAANLGDTDAMEEAAWCYLEGFGGPKDKFKAAQYLRLAEKRGSKVVGNSWIWKDKYNPK